MKNYIYFLLLIFLEVYQYIFIKLIHWKKGKIKYFGINLIHNKKYISNDGKFKKGLLIFIASIFDAFNLIIAPFSNFSINTKSEKSRLSSFQIISSALICKYAFGFKVKNHHKISLIIIGLLIILFIIIDIIYAFYYRTNKAIFQYFLIIYYNILFSFSSCIEKYLVDANYMNPFFILMLEGVFQLIMALLFTIKINPFNNIRTVYKTFSIGYFIGLIILYIFELASLIIVNIYRIYCNVIYSPMARSLMDYMLNPIVNIINYFMQKEEFYRNILYLIIIEIICFFISIFGCVFNEYIILYCCGLEYETQDVIADRANDTENIYSLNNEKLIDNNDEISDNDNNDSEYSDRNTAI